MPLSKVRPLSPYPLPQTQTNTPQNPPSLTTHPLSTPLPTPSPTNHLHITPPELLLQIISHLPPTTLYPLSQTSHYLSTFLHQHAAIICNTYILSSPSYSRAAAILSSQHNDGWLLPTHRAVLDEEARITKDKILFSGCRCTSCFSVIQSQSQPSLDLEKEDLDAEIAEMIRGEECKARKAIDTATRLSQPGPQYLVFLEKYAWEVITRHTMSSLSPPSTATSTANGEEISPPSTADANDQENREGESEEETEEEKQEKEKQEALFAFMIGNYCVRRFLDSAEKALTSFHTSSYPKPTTSSPTLPISPHRPTKKLRKRPFLARRREVEVLAETQVEEVIPDRPDRPSHLDSTNTSPQTTPRRLIFGEISSSQTLLPSSTSTSTSNSTSAHKERWQDSLFWYYRSLTPAEPDSDEHVEEKVEKKERGCFAVVKRGFGILGRKVGGWGLFRGKAGCLGARRVRMGGFSVLEG